MKKIIFLLFSCFFALGLHAEDKKVFYPAVNTPAANAVATPPTSGANPVATSFFYLIILGGVSYAAYLHWRQKKIPTLNNTKGASLDILTTRPLGNRQFLVVVRYKEKDVLLGVGQGFITHLESTPNSAEGSSCQK